MEEFWDLVLSMRKDTQAAARIRVGRRPGWHGTAATTVCLAAWILVASGCALNPHLVCCHSSAPASGITWEQIQPLPAVARRPNWDRELFRLPESGWEGRPPVVLLHELPGLTRATIQWAATLASQGFAVYVPCLFGKPLAEPIAIHSIGNTVKIPLMDPEWIALSGNATSPILNRKIRPFVREVGRIHGRPVGVIGMCLTGAFPLALLDEPCVAAAVCAQPALPIVALTDAGKRSFGLNSNDYAAAAARCRRQSGVEILVVRFKSDNLSPAERLAAITEAFEGSVVSITINSPDEDFGISRQAHPTLTYCVPPCFEKPEGRLNPVLQARKDVVRFLHDRLD